MAERNGPAVAFVVVGATLLAGCASTVPGTPVPARITDAERTLVRGYFDALNTAGGKGLAQQQQLLRETQHPDYRKTSCELPSVTLRIEPVMSTLRASSDWTPSGGKVHPRGHVYAVAVTVTALKNDAEVGNQIGSQHVVAFNGKAYGFAPCASG